MTGYTVHTGSNDKFSNGWDNIFGKSANKRKAAQDNKKNLASSQKEKKVPQKDSKKKSK